jgi:dipeptidyl aminopeptidase/acylaminoacyl peptidase
MRSISALGLVVMLLLAGCGGATKKAAEGSAAGARAGEPGGRYAQGQAPLFNPLSLEALRERKYPTSTIVVERRISETGPFRTAIVSYESDNLVLFAVMKTPNEPAPPRGFPVVIVDHGALTSNGYSALENSKAFTDYFASRGFLVLKPDYRGYGESTSREGGWARVGYYAVDVLNLIAAVPTIRGADARNIFVLGQGMGGDVTLRALEATGKVRAASLWAPVAAPMPMGLVYYTRSRREAVESRIRAQYGETELPKLSTVDNLALLSTPVEIHHGTEDQQVPYEWSVELADRLRKAGLPYELYGYEGEDHDLSKGGFRLAIARDELFFREHMDRSR